MKKFVLAVSLILLYFAGCATEPGVDVQKLDSRIFITLKEDFSSGTRKFYLDCKTENIYPCLNYTIANQVQRNGNNIAINITNVTQPTECSEGSGPAKTLLDLGTLSPGSTYELQVLVNESVLQATITVTSKSITLSKNEVKWIKVLNPELKRIPENAIWGYAAYSNDTVVVNQVPAFFDTLKTIGATEYAFEKGSYGFFDVDSAGAVKMDIHVDLPNVKPFAYVYNNSMTNLRNLIKYYGKSKPVSAAIFNTDGDAFYTWELADEP